MIYIFLRKTFVFPEPWENMRLQEEPEFPSSRDVLDPPRAGRRPAAQGRDHCYYGLYSKYSRGGGGGCSAVLSHIHLSFPQVGTAERVRLRFLLRAGLTEHVATRTPSLKPGASYQTREVPEKIPMSAGWETAGAGTMRPL